MNMKSFSIGAVSGALAVAAIVWFLVDTGESHDVRSPAAQAESGPADVASLAELAEQTTRQATLQAQPVDGHSVEGESAEPASSEAEVTITEGRSEFRRPWPEGAYDQIMQERKDESWAYYMEQAMLQFLAGHPSTAEFEITYIECRTTQCQLRVAGYAEGTGPTWSRIMYEMSEEPWYEFGQRGTSSGTREGEFVIIENLWRR